MISREVLGKPFLVLLGEGKREGVEWLFSAAIGPTGRQILLFVLEREPFACSALLPCLSLNSHHHPPLKFERERARILQPLLCLCERVLCVARLSFLPVYTYLSVGA